LHTVIWEEEAVKKSILVLILAVLVIFAAGCGPKKQEKTGPFAVLEDQMGRKVVINKLPQRIISLSPGNTEIAFSIGLEQRIVGVTDFCNYPAEALKKEKVGGFAKPNLEAIIALKPDLVLAGNMHDTTIKKLEEMGIAALILSPASLEEVYASMKLVGAATGNEEAAAKVVAGMQGRIQKVQEKLAAIPAQKRVRVYYEVYSKPLMSAGGLSLINEVLLLAGGKNIFADVLEKHPKISDEAVVERDPQYIFFPKMHGSEEIKGDFFAQRPVWKKITAVKEEKVFGVESDAISRPGPRLINAVEEVAILLYPDCFK